LKALTKAEFVEKMIRYKAEKRKKRQKTIDDYFIDRAIRREKIKGGTYNYEMYYRT